MTLQKILMECICIYEAFRKLGFKAEEIFFVPEMEAHSIGMAVESQGLRFVVTMGPRPSGMSPEEAIQEWKKVAIKYNDGKIPNFPDVYYHSFVFRNRHDLVTRMAQKGFRFKPDKQAMDA